MSTRIAILIGWALLVLPVPARAAGATPEAAEFFETKVRPVLAENCYKCHGGGKKKGKLQLDSRAGLLKGGESGPAVVPGRPEQSLLVKAIHYKDDLLRMPPKSKLSDDHITDLTTWVAMGAPWPRGAGSRTAAKGPGAFDLRERAKYWCWQPLKRATPPPVKHMDWPHSPVDHFILAKLEAQGLSPAKPADRRTLLRRVTYDLTGLPPTPAEIDAFLSDRSPNAYEKVVDRLLASPHYGERWGRHWLDLVRFAETYGHEYDFEMPEAYLYRDYVIRAFNADVPYDQFVLEHIAGDLLPQPRRHPTDGYNESVIGTGFWFLGEATHSPVDVRADEAGRIDNQIDVLAKAFLGLTVSCARCHDHKFDAISTKDYYALVGYLESSRFQRAFLDAPARTRDAVGQLKQLQAQSRAIAVGQAAQVLQTQSEGLAKCLLANRTGGPSAGGRWSKLCQAARGRPENPLYPWTELGRTGSTLNAQQFAAKRQALVQHLKHQAEKARAADARPMVFEDFNKGTYQDWLVTGQAFGTGPSRVPAAIVQPDPHRPVRDIARPGTAHSGLVSDRLQGVLRSRTFVIARKKILYHAAGRGAHINLIIDNYQLIRDPIYGGLTVKIDHGDRPEWRVQDVSMWLGQRAYIEVVDDGRGYVAVDRILFSDDGPPADAPSHLLIRILDDPHLDSLEGLARKYQELFLEVLGQWRSGRLQEAGDCANRVALLNWLLHSDLATPPDGEASQEQQADRKKLAALMETYRQVEAGLPVPRLARAMADGTGWDEPVHIRGNCKNLGEVVPRRFLQAIAGSRQPAPAGGSGRLELARRMLDSSDALLPRVMVNRIWQHHFGEGIVRSVDNFGVLGEAPTHPELLDYLATEFVRQGWSLKKMHRLMVLSSAYRVASRPDDPTAERLDPQNRLLHRMPIRRLEAESIRDAILAVSGRLDAKMEGPGVLPYLTPHMAGRGRPSASGPLDGDGRRSIYLNVRRNFLTPMFLAFDYPIPFTTIGRRSVSNVPAQALALMNNPFVVQQANVWARRALADPGLSPSRRIESLYVTAFGRPPEAAELAAALAFLDEQTKHYGRADDPRAWSDLCHVLINVKEFIFID